MSANHQWLKFWPQDWQNDTALATCSIGARGLWISLICVMHQSEPYGHLTVNGRPATMKQIAALARVTVKEAETLLDELEAAGAFSRTDDGVIFSRRMVRDEEASLQGRENIAKRKDHVKASRVEGSNSPPSTSPPNRGAASTPSKEATSPPNTLEAEAESDSEPIGSAPVGAGPPDARAQLWTTGLSQFRALTGKSDPQSRRALGGLLKSANDDCGLVNSALAEAADLRPIEPMAWLTRRIRGPDEFRNGFLQLIAEEGMPSVKSNPVTAFLEGPYGKPN